MNSTVWLIRILRVGAVLETLVGLGVLIAPRVLVSLLLGAPLGDTGLIVARLAGGALLALGVACWFASQTPSARTGLGVAWALLIYNVIACVTLALAPRTTPTSRVLVVGASLLHGLLAAGLLAALTPRRHHHGVAL